MKKFSVFFKYSMQSLKGNYLKLLILTALNIVSSLLVLFLPILSGNLINTLIEFPNINSIIYYCKIILIINVVNFILSYIITILNIDIQVNSSFTLNYKLLKKLQKISILFIQKQDITYLNQRINNDCNAIIIFSINLLMDIVVNIVYLIISTLFLFRISNKIFISIIVIVLTYATIYKLFRGKILKIKRLLLDVQANYFAKLQEQLQYIKFVKIYNSNKQLDSSLKNIYLEMKRILFQNQRYMYMLNFSEQIMLLIAHIILYLYGGLEVISGRITVGMFSIMSSYFNKIVSSLKYFSSLYQQYLTTYVSYERNLELEKEKNDCYGYKTLDKVDNIILENVTFGYNEKNIIVNFTYNFEKGNIYQICGKNGIGKSTLINLIIGIFTEYQGKIKYNSIDSKQMDIYEFREKFISVVPQNPLLVSGTILDNIILDEQYDTNIIINYLLDFNLINKKEQADKLLSKNITDFQKNVSGGEEQKINIIRELLRNREIFIFDEPSSALDIESRKILVNCINKLKKNHIIFIITHDTYLQSNIEMVKVEL